MAHVLIVEDEILLLMMLSDVFEDEGYEVTSALNGKLAWEALHQRKPDLIITDFMMPVMTGLELARAVRADADLCSIPIILVSAAQADIGRSHPDLFQIVFEKPYRHDALLEEVVKQIRL